jgi:hypothetical protein
MRADDSSFEHHKSLTASGNEKLAEVLLSLHLRAARHTKLGGLSVDGRQW